MAEKTAPKLILRPATAEDIKPVHALIKRAYPGFPPYSVEQLRGQLHHFAPGVFVAEYEGKIVGYAASIRLPEERALHPHTWSGITGGGYASTHDPEGDYLYGYEVCVDPDYRGLRIGQRIYAYRRKLCRQMQLKGIVFCGRIPGLAKRIKQVGSVEEYVRRVERRQMRDPVLSFQLGNGFEVQQIVEDYLPTDSDSLGYGVLLLWRNPAVQPRVSTTSSVSIRPTSGVRVVAVQYQQRRVASFDEFARIVAYFVDAAAEKRADFLLFPELFTIQLLSIEGLKAGAELQPMEQVKLLATYTDQVNELLRDLAIRYHVNLVGGSTAVTQKNGSLHNVAHVFLRDGSVYEQHKIHPTPGERRWWQIEGGSRLNAIDTDCGPIGVLICYDSEFPELGRVLTDQGANILFVPYSTEERQGALRVRYSAHARAVENQVYVVTAGNVGNLPLVQNMDIHYAQSCIITPCDFPFARDGIAADTTPMVEQMAFADLHLDSLHAARQNGTVQNWRDRRHDLYRVTWNGNDTE